MTSLTVRATSKQSQLNTRQAKEAPGWIVPVEELANLKGESNSGYTVPAESCIMKFSGKQTECGYEIIERCKTLAISGIGSTSVTFSDNKSIRLDMPVGTSDFTMRVHKAR